MGSNGLEKPKKKEKELEKDEGWSSFGKQRKEDLGVLDRDADQESWTRIRKNALWTVPRQAAEKATFKRGLSYWLGTETIECLI
ncbi:uncharacterized protein TNCV_344761 [Trichonephila clavipes]|nr:uncharacterized protein TNCV_344761 [Trichonephila clavipes]